jgi:non-heme chloroperoxidase
MAYVPVGTENKYPLELHFTDRGAGEPVVMIHGYPFSGKAWECQEHALIEAGYRVITYDRRGFGESSKPSIGYDYDTFAEDLDKVIKHLELKNVTLVGHSMGTGEVARYISRYGSENVVRAVMVSPIPPFLLKTPDNETGVEQKIFDDFKTQIKKDRYAFLTSFLKNFYGNGMMSTDGVSEEKLRADFTLGASSGAAAFLKCVDTWLEDFREDIAKMNVPLLIIHGDADKVLPIDSTARVLVKTVGELVEIPGGSHGIPWTHAKEVSAAILDFLSRHGEVIMTRAVDELRPGLS